MSGLCVRLLWCLVLLWAVVIVLDFIALIVWLDLNVLVRFVLWGLRVQLDYWFGFGVLSWVILWRWRFACGVHILCATLVLCGPSSFVFSCLIGVCLLMNGPSKFMGVRRCVFLMIRWRTCWARLARRLVGFWIVIDCRVCIRRNILCIACLSACRLLWFILSRLRLCGILMLTLPLVSGLTRRLSLLSMLLLVRLRLLWGLRSTVRLTSRMLLCRRRFTCRLWLLHVRRLTVLT